MRLSFSSLACPDATFSQIVAMAAAFGYDGIELRFVQGEDALWKLPDFQGEKLAAARRSLADAGLVISCLDTSCRFHFPDATERNRWLEEGRRMADLAAALGAPGLRIFGDTIQPGADRTSTRTWIAENMARLAEMTSRQGVEVWLESHGDFTSSRETLEILQQAGASYTGVVWDPANSFIESREMPVDGAATLGATIRHTHIKDVRWRDDAWQPVLPGEGNFPLGQLLQALQKMNYDRFVSFEWEKKWHPEIAEAALAVPYFIAWFRENCQN